MFFRYLKRVKQNHCTIFESTEKFIIHFVLCYIKCSYKDDDTNTFLGFHKLYYCKCSCVYIL